MAYSDYTLSIEARWASEEHKEIFVEVDWPGLDGTEADYTEKIEVWTKYGFIDATGVRRYMREEPATTFSQLVPHETKYSFLWSFPENALDVEFKARAYAKTYDAGGYQDSHWGVSYVQCTTGLQYWGDARIPDTAPTPTITRDRSLGSQVILELTDIRDEGNNKNVNKVEFQILKVNNDNEDGEPIAGTFEATVSDYNTCRYVATIGSEYGYRFRCRYWGSNGQSDHPEREPSVVAGPWSPLSEVVHGVPNAPKIEYIVKEGKNDVYFKISETSHVYQFQIQVATREMAFKRMDAWEIANPDLIEDQEARAQALLLDPPVAEEFTNRNSTFNHTLPASEQGRMYYRVRAMSDQTDAMYSGWSDPYEFTFGDPLRAPIIWSAASFANIGDPAITLCIMHNSPTGSKPTGAKIEYHINGGRAQFFPAEGYIDPPQSSGDSAANTFSVPFPLSDITEECEIRWHARTFEDAEPGTSSAEPSPWSEQNTFWVYNKPVLHLTFPDIPVSEYETITTEGGEQSVPVVASYPLHFLAVPTLIGAQSITSYTVRIVTATTFKDVDQQGRPVNHNRGDVIYTFYDVKSVGSLEKYIGASEVLLRDGCIYELQVTASVNTGAIAEASALFVVDFPVTNMNITCSFNKNMNTASLALNPMATIRQNDQDVPAPNTILSVYRKNQDGTLVPIEENIPNSRAVYITDPHPNLRYAEYRIVAIDTVTGGVQFFDTPTYDIGIYDIILQWDDYLGDVLSTATPDSTDYVGNMVRLPFNVDVSESANLENNMVKYIGRKDPVSYYGTQTGYTANWSTVIPKYETEIIRKLRQLQVYPGDVYVREPSGTGYWANVKVTFPINHVALTVSVSLTITRVEGGK